MADTTPRAPRYVELLSPERSAARQPVTQTNNRRATAADNWLPAPLIQRVLDKIATRNAQAHAGRIAAENHIVALLTERLRLLEEFARKLGRFEALPALRHAETAQVYAEVEQTFDNINHERQMRRIRQEGELIRARRELDDLKRAPSPALPAPPKESRANQKVAAIKRIREECDLLVATILAGRREEDLDEDDRQLVDACRLSAMNRIQNLLHEDD